MEAGPFEAEALERAVLLGCGLDPGAPPLEALGRVYRELSDALNAAEEAGGVPSGRLLGPGQGEDERLLGAVWGLVYGARTHALARWTLDGLGVPARMVELGSGWGPFGLAAAQAGCSEVELVDVASAALERGSRIFQAAGAPLPRVRCGGPEVVPRGTGLVAIPYALGEMIRTARDPVLAGARLLAGLLEAVEPGGTVLVLEAGTRASARRLQAIRDALVASGTPIRGPCAGAPRCPALLDAGDWCHFTWPFEPGPVARRVADLAGRRWREVHVSWLALGSADPSGGWRVLERRERGKGKLEVRLCGPEGFVPVTALGRNREAWAALSGLPVGGTVSVDAGKLVARGDGLRLEETTALGAIARF